MTCGYPHCTKLFIVFGIRKHNDGRIISLMDTISQNPIWIPYPIIWMISASLIQYGYGMTFPFIGYPLARNPATCLSLKPRPLQDARSMAVQLLGHLAEAPCSRALVVVKRWCGTRFDPKNWRFFIIQILYHSNLLHLYLYFRFLSM